MPRLLAAVAFAVVTVLAGQAFAADSESGATAPAASETATFASGCFWCSESDFEKVPGVLSVVSGYTGGTTPSPTYEEVGQGDSGHIEAVEITYDPAIVSFKILLDHYWRTTDVVDGGGQFCDRGSQYRPAIFAHGAGQKKLAEDGKAALDKSGVLPKPIAVEIRDATTFTPAEVYHQDYYKKNPLRYRVYRHGCGRDARIQQLWGDAPSH
ncbi:MAG: peptide-methionine (S)-S-oxide reductase MsrA [Hyphomicrobium sp.]